LPPVSALPAAAVRVWGGAACKGGFYSFLLRRRR